MIRCARPHRIGGGAAPRSDPRTVRGAAGPGVVAVGVSDDRAFHRLPRIDVEPARGAEQPRIGFRQQHRLIVGRSPYLRPIGAKNGDPENRRRLYHGATDMYPAVTSDRPLEDALERYWGYTSFR